MGRQTQCVVNCVLATVPISPANIDTSDLMGHISWEGVMNWWRDAAKILTLEVPWDFWRSHQPLIHILPPSLQCCMQYLVILDPIVTTLNFMCGCWGIYQKLMEKWVYKARRFHECTYLPYISRIVHTICILLWILVFWYQSIHQHTSWSLPCPIINPILLNYSWSLHCLWDNPWYHWSNPEIYGKVNHMDSLRRMTSSHQNKKQGTPPWQLCTYKIYDLQHIILKSTSWHSCTIKVQQNPIHI